MQWNQALWQRSVAEFPEFLEPLVAKLGRSERREGAALYVQGLLMPGERKSIEPMAEPSVVVDITGTYAAKVKAMEAYGSQHELVGGVFQMLEGRALERGHLIQARYGEAFRRVTYRPRKVTDVASLLE